MFVYVFVYVFKFVLSNGDTSLITLSSITLNVTSNSFNFKSMHILQPTLAIDVKNKNYD